MSRVGSKKHTLSANRRIWPESSVGSALAFIAHRQQVKGLNRVLFDISHNLPGTSPQGEILLKTAHDLNYACPLPDS